MKVRGLIGLFLLLALAFGACSKDETVAPCNTGNGTLRGSDNTSFPLDQAGTAQRDPVTAELRDGDPNEGGGSGGEGGGISDDGDDGSDSEENKKTGH